MLCRADVSGHNLETGELEHQPTVAKILTYLCPHCQDTHFQLELPEADTVIQVRMSDQTREHLVGLLCNPPTSEAITAHFDYTKLKDD